ncbi:MAG: type II secretion system minor pseudopilin GspK [Desulfuromonadaceae bacterium]
MTGRLKNESGFALILTLVVTALMVAVVIEMIHQVYVDTSLSRGFRDGQQASILAESGVTGAAALLNVGLANQTYTSLSDRWATPLKLEDEAGSLEITISEESSKININDLLIQPKTLEALQRLGTRLQLPGEIWSAVADWVDSDDLPRSGGAESSYYSTLKPPYKARNNKLLTLTELSLVRGVTPEVLGKLRPYLTTFSEEANSPLSRININTAPKEVLAALDELVDDRMAEQIIEERRLLPFKSPGELSRVPGMDKIINNLTARITTKGNLFRITSVARVKDSVRTVEAVVRLSGEVLSWQEY